MKREKIKQEANRVRASSPAGSETAARPAGTPVGLQPIGTAGSQAGLSDRASHGEAHPREWPTGKVSLGKCTASSCTHTSLSSLETSLIRPKSPPSHQCPAHPQHTMPSPRRPPGPGHCQLRTPEMRGTLLRETKYNHKKIKTT